MNKLYTEQHQNEGGNLVNLTNNHPISLGREKEGIAQL